MLNFKIYHCILLFLDLLLFLLLEILIKININSRQSILVKHILSIDWITLYQL